MIIEQEKPASTLQIAVKIDGIEAAIAGLERVKIAAQEVSAALRAIGAGDPVLTTFTPLCGASVVRTQPEAKYDELGFPIN